MNPGTLLDAVLINLSRIAVLYLFTAAGYLLARSGVLKGDSARPVSTLLSCFFLPCTLAHTLSSQFDLSLISRYLTYFLSGAAVVLLFWFPAKLIAKKLAKAGSGGIFAYAMLFPNISYLGYPLAEAVLPSLYLELVIFSLPFTIAANTLGLGLLGGDRGTAEKRNGIVGVARKILSPPIIGVAAGIILALLPFDTPAFLSDFLGYSSGYMAPLAMLLTGIVVARGKINVERTPIRPYLTAVAFRMLVFPSAATALTLILCAAAKLSYSLVFTTAAAMYLPCGMNMIFLSESGSRESLDGAKCALLSNVAALAVIPPVYAVISALASV